MATTWQDDCVDSTPSSPPASEVKALWHMYTKTHPRWFQQLQLLLALVACVPDIGRGQVLRSAALLRWTFRTRFFSVRSACIHERGQAPWVLGTASAAKLCAQAHQRT